MVSAAPGSHRLLSRTRYSAQVKNPEIKEHIKEILYEKGKGRRRISCYSAIISWKSLQGHKVRESIDGLSL
jgi:hypothetical protein